MKNQERLAVGSRTTRTILAATAIGALATVGLTACVRDTEITVDGLPVTNAASHIRQIDGLWLTHLASTPVRPTTSEDSACFYLMYDNVALNSIVCGPVFWLGDEGPTWDYYPLETVLSSDGRSLQAIARRSFMPDYPMSDADDLFRPDRAQPHLNADLAEPAAPVTTEPVLYMADLPEDRRITSEMVFESPVSFMMDGAGCSTLLRTIWSTHVGTGAGVIAAPEDHQFLTIVSLPRCALADFLLIEGADPAPDVDGGVTILVDGASTTAPEWRDQGSYVVPAGTPDVARLESTLAGNPVSVDLLTGMPDEVTASLAEPTRESPVPATSGQVIEDRWTLTVGATGRSFQPPDAGEGPAAVITSYLPQFGTPPRGERWLVVGATLEFDVTDPEGATIQPGDIQLSASLEDSGRMVRLIEVPSEGGADSTRTVTAIVSVPEATASARLTLGGTLSGWTASGAGGRVTIPDAAPSVTLELDFPQR